MAIFKKQIGEAIRERRQQLGISMAELGKRAGVTSAFIGMVEKNKSGLSLDSLNRIADGLEMSVLQLLMENETTRNDNPHVTVENRRSLPLPGSGLEVELLTPDVNHKMAAHISHITPKYGDYCKKFKIPTEEFIYVLSGEIIITLEYGIFTLNQGDSIYFQGEQLCRLDCGDVEEASFLCVITPPAY